MEDPPSPPLHRSVPVSYSGLSTVLIWCVPVSYPCHLYYFRINTVLKPFILFILFLCADYIYFRRSTLGLSHDASRSVSFPVLRFGERPVQHAFII